MYQPILMKHLSYFPLMSYSQFLWNITASEPNHSGFISNAEIYLICDYVQSICNAVTMLEINVYYVENNYLQVTTNML
jgi:hypothetical protein